jgi:CheY-specific phosphatase CheX/anti-anti-sigma regulatory factor
MSGTVKTNTNILYARDSGVLEYEVHSNEGFYLIRIFSGLNEERYNTLALRLNTLIAEGPEHFIVDCNNLIELPVLWPRLLVQLSQALAKDHKRICLTNASQKLKSSIVSLGLDSSFSPTSRMIDAFQVLDIKTAGTTKLDVALVNPFILATIRTIEAQAKLSPQAERIYSREENSELLGEVNGVIPLNSNNFQGYVIISFSKKLALALSRLVLNETSDEINETIKSAVAEITNIVFISGKRKLNEVGFAVDSALPKVIIGGKLSGELIQKSAHVLTVPFETSEGTFYVEVRLP